MLKKAIYRGSALFLCSMPAHQLSDNEQLIKRGERGVFTPGVYSKEVLEITFP